MSGRLWTRGTVDTVHCPREEQEAKDIDGTQTYTGFRVSNTGHYAAGNQVIYQAHLLIFNSYTSHALVVRLLRCFWFIFLMQANGTLGLMSTDKGSQEYTAPTHAVELLGKCRCYGTTFMEACQ